MEFEFLRFLGAVVFFGLIFTAFRWAFNLGSHPPVDLHDTIREEGEDW